MVHPQGEGASTVSDPMEGVDSDQLEVRGCGCKSPCCPLCSGSFAYRASRQVLEDCSRLGVTSVAMLTVTRDPKRFSDPHHVVTAHIAFQLGKLFWWCQSDAYRALWGAEPLWWSFREVHDGTRGGSDASAARGSDHLHMLFPAPRARMKRAKWDKLWRTGNEISGRTQYGWGRKGEGPYVLPVESAAGYASKAINYAAKSVPSDAMLDSRRLQFATCSRAVSAGRPSNLKRRDAQERFQDRKRWAREVYKVTRRRLGPKSEATLAAKRVYREYVRPSVVRGPMRPHRERVAHCRDKIVVTRVADGKFVTGAPVSWSTFLSDVVCKPSRYVEWLGVSAGPGTRVVDSRLVRSVVLPASDVMPRIRALSAAVVPGGAAGPLAGASRGGASCCGIGSEGKKLGVGNPKGHANEWPLCDRGSRDKRGARGSGVVVPPMGQAASGGALRAIERQAATGVGGAREGEVGTEADGGPGCRTGVDRPQAQPPQAACILVKSHCSIIPGSAVREGP